MGGGLKRASLSYGFTIIELLIVIIVIAILATLVITAYNGVQTKAADVQHKDDQATIYKAILVARENTGKTLMQFTGSGCSNCGCLNYTPTTEPKDQPKSSPCWTAYYNDINTISAAAGINLDSLKDGDARGNPAFLFDENEGEQSSDPCRAENVAWWSGNGVGVTGQKRIPFSLPQCQ